MTDNFLATTLASIRTKLASVVTTMMAVNEQERAKEIKYMKIEEKRKTSAEMKQKKSERYRANLMIKKRAGEQRDDNK